MCDNQRRQWALFPQSTQVPVQSPYPTFTQEQLNMRRKVEILKYNSQTISKKMTKTQRWSLVAKGKYVEVDIAPNCEIPTLTTGCDVPGPPMLLYLDSSVPLYNYNTQTYSGMNTIPMEAVTYIKTISPTDSSTLVTTKSRSLGILKIKDQLSNTIYFTIWSPISIWVNFHTESSIDVDVNISITNISVRITYDGIPISLLQSETINHSTIPMKINSIQSGHGYGSHYVGMVSITNMYFPINSYSIYGIDIITTLDVSNIDKFTSFHTGIFTNVTSNVNVSNGFQYTSGNSSTDYDGGGFLIQT